MASVPVSRWSRLTLAAARATVSSSGMTLRRSACEDDNRRDDDRGFAFEVMAKGGRLRVFGQVFEPAGGVNEVEFRTAPCGHDNRLSIEGLWRCRGAP